MGRHSDRSSDSDRSERRREKREKKDKHKKDKKDKKRDKAHRRSTSPGASKQSSKASSKLTDASGFLDSILEKTEVPEPTLYPSNQPPHLRMKTQPPAPTNTPGIVPTLLPPDGLDGGGSFGSVAARVYVGCINYRASEADVRGVFSRFGTIRAIAMPHDPEKGHHRGYAFVEYMEQSVAELVRSLPRNAISFGGLPCRIDRPTQEGGETAAAAAAAAPAPRPQSAPDTFQPIDVPVGASLMGGQRGAPSVGLAQQLAAARGLRPAAEAPKAQPAASSAAPAASPDVPTAIVISGMIRSDEEVDQELVDDIRRECSRFGRVLDVNFYKTDPREGPHVAVEFEKLNDAKACVQKMHGRLFDGRPLTSGLLSREYYMQVRN